MTTPQLFWVAWGLLNLVSFGAMGFDKHFARTGQRRIRERTLFLWAALGGIGAVAGMFLFHHKTRHWYFRVFFPLLCLLQLSGVFFLYYKGFF